MLEQWVMHWAFKHVVLGSTLGLKTLKVFSVTNCHCCTGSALLSVSRRSVNTVKHKPIQQSKDS